VTRPVESIAVHPLLTGVLRGAAPSALRPLLPEPDGWAPILDDAVRHGLIPLLSRWLKTADLGSPLPPRLAERLDADVLGTAARNSQPSQGWKTRVDLASQRTGRRAATVTTSGSISPLG